MVDEADRIAPNRNRKADGSIGDTAHSSRTSDHNPAPDGYVYALDLTHAPASGFDAHARARLVVARADRRIKYVISDRMIARGYDKPGVPAWTWTPYSGPNPHTFHAHFSVDAAFRNDTRPWWPTATPEPIEEDDMAIFVEMILSSYREAGRNPEAKGNAPGVVYWLNELRKAASDARRLEIVNYVRHLLGLKPVA